MPTTTSAGAGGGATPTPTHCTPRGVSLRVLTYNVWGVFNAKLRMERLTRIAHKIPNYDIIVLQEQFLEKDFIIMWRELPLAVRQKFYYKRFTSSFYGSGCTLISRFPIIQSFFHAFPLQGYPEMVLQGDFYAQKGVALGTVLVPNTYLDGMSTPLQSSSSASPPAPAAAAADGAGAPLPTPSTYSPSACGSTPVRVYTTHLVAVYTQISQLEDWRTERYLPYRVSQAISLAQFVANTAHPNDPIIIAGDFNCSPGSLELEIMRILLKRWGFHFESGLPRPLPIPPAPQYAAFPPLSSTTYAGRESSTYFMDASLYPPPLRSSFLELPSPPPTSSFPLHSWPMTIPTPLSRSHAFYTYADCNPFNASSTSYFKLLHLQGDLPVQIDHLFFNTARWVVESFEDCPDYEAPSTSNVVMALGDPDHSGGYEGGGGGEEKDTHNAVVGERGKHPHLIHRRPSGTVSPPSRSCGGRGGRGGKWVEGPSTAYQVATPFRHQRPTALVVLTREEIAIPKHNPPLLPHCSASSLSPHSPSYFSTDGYREYVHHPLQQSGRPKGSNSSPRPARRGDTRAFSRPLQDVSYSYDLESPNEVENHHLCRGVYDEIEHQDVVFPLTHERESVLFFPLLRIFLAWASYGIKKGMREWRQGKRPRWRWWGREGTDGGASGKQNKKTNDEYALYHRSIIPEGREGLSSERRPRGTFPLSRVDGSPEYGGERMRMRTTIPSCDSLPMGSTSAPPGTAAGGVTTTNTTVIRNTMMGGSSRMRPSQEALGMSQQTARKSGASVFEDAFQDVFVGDEEDEGKDEDVLRYRGHFSKKNIKDNGQHDHEWEAGQLSRSVLRPPTPNANTTATALSPSLPSSSSSFTVFHPASLGRSGARRAEDLDGRWNPNKVEERDVKKEEEGGGGGKRRSTMRYGDATIHSSGKLPRSQHSSSSFPSPNEVQEFRCHQHHPKQQQQQQQHYYHQQMEDEIEDDLWIDHEEPPSQLFPLSDHYGVAIRLRLLPPSDAAPPYPYVGGFGRSGAARHHYRHYAGRSGDQNPHQALCFSPHFTGTASSSSIITTPRFPSSALAPFPSCASFSSSSSLSSDGLSESSFTDEERLVIHHVKELLHNTAVRFEYQFEYLKLFAIIAGGVTAVVLLRVLLEQQRHRRLLASMWDLMAKRMSSFPSPASPASSPSDGGEGSNSNGGNLLSKTFAHFATNAAAVATKAGQQFLTAASSVVAAPVLAAKNAVEQRLTNLDHSDVNPNNNGGGGVWRRLWEVGGGVGRSGQSVLNSLLNKVEGALPVDSLTNNNGSSTSSASSENRLGGTTRVTIGSSTSSNSSSPTSATTTTTPTNSSPLVGRAITRLLHPFESSSSCPPPPPPSPPSFSHLSLLSSSDGTAGWSRNEMLATSNGGKSEIIQMGPSIVPPPPFSSSSSLPLPATSTAGARSGNRSHPHPKTGSSFSLLSSYLKQVPLNDLGMRLLLTPPSGVWTTAVLMIGPTVSLLSFALGMLHRLGNAKLFREQLSLIQMVCSGRNDSHGGGSRGRRSPHRHGHHRHRRHHRPPTPPPPLSTTSKGASEEDGGGQGRRASRKRVGQKGRKEDGEKRDTEKEVTVDL